MSFSRHPPYTSSLGQRSVVHVIIFNPDNSQSLHDHAISAHVTVGAYLATMATRNVKPNEEKVLSLRSELQAVILSAVVTDKFHFLEEAIAVSIEYKSVFYNDLTSSTKSFRLFDFFPEQTKIKVSE